MVEPLKPTSFWKREAVTHKSFKPFTVAIGEAAVSWNALQDELGNLFLHVMGSKYARVPMAVWNAIDNDRLQRKMLRGAAQAKFTNRILDDIEWLITEADKLSDARNDAIHSPLISLTNVGNKRLSKVEAPTHFKNPRALKLKGKDLLSEFNWCRDTAITLQGFCSTLMASIALAADPWPDRPRLPNRGQKKYP